MIFTSQNKDCRIAYCNIPPPPLYGVKFGSWQTAGWLPPQLVTACILYVERPLSEKASLGLALSLPRIIICSFLAFFSSFRFSFCFSSSIFICSSIILSRSSACCRSIKHWQIPYAFNKKMYKQTF